MGEGGAIVTDNTKFYGIALSLRDWGGTAGASPGKTIPVKTGSEGSLAIYLKATTTNTSTRTSDII